MVLSAFEFLIFYEAIIFNVLTYFRRIDRNIGLRLVFCEFNSKKGAILTVYVHDRK